jgi:hypothetical protein
VSKMMVGAKIWSVDDGRGVEPARAQGGTGVDKELGERMPGGTVTANRWLQAGEALHGRDGELGVSRW